MSIDYGEKVQEGVDYVYVKRAYAQAVKLAGGKPVFICPDLSPESAGRIFDGIIIPGGGDVPPRLYGASESSSTREESLERIEWERQLIDRARSLMKPLLGICYGMQLINVHYGGTLHQDLPTPKEGVLDHGGSGKCTSHEIFVPQDSFLYPILGATARVSSAHRQAVKSVAPGFCIAASSEDGIVESIQSENIFGLEWHPESDCTGPLIYSLFLREAAKSR